MDPEEIPIEPVAVTARLWVGQESRPGMIQTSNRVYAKQLLLDGWDVLVPDFRTARLILEYMGVDALTIEYDILGAQHGLLAIKEWNGF